jgi:alkaline phosphatase
MTAQIKRIGKWTAKAALEAALEDCKDDDTLIIVTIDHEDQTMKYWSANATNMQVNWMADNIKMDVFQGAL